MHGHQVGGTNPSRVEALGAGNAVLAHDNPYNRWVAGDAGVYFRDEAECERWIERILGEGVFGVSPSPQPSPVEGEGVDWRDAGALLTQLRAAARRRHAEAFTWARVLGAYERLLAEWG